MSQTNRCLPIPIQILTERIFAAQGCGGSLVGLISAILARSYQAGLCVAEKSGQASQGRRPRDGRCFSFDRPGRIFSAI